MNRTKIGLLPLYLELYDKSVPEARKRIESFLKIIKAGLEERSMELVTTPVCRLKDEFVNAVSRFENEKVDAIVTIHLAYSPSLESAGALAGTKIPLIILDTTPAYDFGPEQESEEILYNHGIHGVQDMCNLLRRNNKEFFLEVGHWKESDVLDRVAGLAKAAKLVRSMRNARVGRIGEPFSGMGDFHVELDILRSTIGVETVLYDFGEGARMIGGVEREALERELEFNIENYEIDGVSREVHEKSLRVNIAVRRWLEREKLTAFTVNFLATQDQPGLPVMPFLEASMAMARGTGYAGEGDVLTAALVGALLSVYPETTFTEMFCPDWKNNSIFLSHMGEMNIHLTADKPRLVEKDFPYTDAENPVVAYGRLKGGKAVLVNLAPCAGSAYTLIISKVDMLEVKSEDRMKDSVHGWFRPVLPIGEFLKRYSMSGGTHHAALVYGEAGEEIAAFGKMMGWNVVMI